MDGSPPRTARGRGLGQPIAAVLLPEPRQRHRPHAAVVPVHARSLFADPLEERRRTARNRPLPPPFWGLRDCTPSLTIAPDAKTWLRTCPAADNAGSVAATASAADVAGNGPRDPARDVTPAGTPGCKSDGSFPLPRPRTGRNNPADGTNRPRNLPRIPLGAGPRAHRN